MNFKSLCATPATAAVFYCNSSTTLASAMYYSMAKTSKFCPKIILIESYMVLYIKFVGWKWKNSCFFLDKSVEHFDQIFKEIEHKKGLIIFGPI